MTTTFWIILGIVVVLALIIVLFYNSFIAKVNRAKEAWADIDVQLKRRYDLIPNLVETVKGYATHERATFDSVTAARSNAMNAQSVEEHSKAENMLTGALKSLFAVAEAYPDLKANENFLELQRELSDTENKIMASRRFYNSTVQELNTSLESFPGNVVASSFGFGQMDLFELADAESAAREPVKVAF